MLEHYKDGPKQEIKGKSQTMQERFHELRDFLGTEKKRIVGNFVVGRPGAVLDPGREIFIGEYTTPEAALQASNGVAPHDTRVAHINFYNANNSSLIISQFNREHIPAAAALTYKARKDPSTNLVNIDGAELQELPPDYAKLVNEFLDRANAALSPPASKEQP